MPDLLLLRHAKSDWGDPSLADIDRPLNDRGRRAARAMGGVLAELPRVDEVWASPARRVRETLAGLVEGGADLPMPRAIDAIYGASAARLLDLLAQARTHRLLLVGHDPAFHDLALHLAREGEDDLLTMLQHKFPTGALVELAVEGDWASIAGASARLVHFIRPRDL